jgi:hypothetical protein
MTIGHHQKIDLNQLIIYEFNPTTILKHNGYPFGIGLLPFLHFSKSILTQKKMFWPRVLWMVLLKNIFNKERYCKDHIIFPFNKDIFITLCNIFYKYILYLFKKVNYKINNPKPRCFDIEKSLIPIYFNFVPFLEKNHEFHKVISKCMCHYAKKDPWALVNHL